MPPSSGELWGHHLMPTQVDVDCLLPTGIIIILRCNRDSTLQSIKVNLWREAKNYPLTYLLQDPDTYIFVSITQDAEREEFYDETRRLCDLRLFQPILKVVEPKGNRDEKILNYEIGLAVGIPVTEFDAMKDLEVMTFRRNMLTVCRAACDERDEQGPYNQAIYVYPPDVEPKGELPMHLQKKINDTMSGKLIICIWVVSANGERQKYTVKVSYLAAPEIVIAEAIRRRTRCMQMTPEQQKQCVLEYQDAYVLKVAGCDQFLLANYPISQYKYVRQCISRTQIPQLMLMCKKGLYSNLLKNTFTMPSYAMRGVGAMEDISSQATQSLWSVEAMLRIKIQCATYVNVSVRDVGKIYVKAGVYHGTEPLCPIKDTEQVDLSNPKWNEWLEFDLYIPDIPRSTRLCFSICSVSRKHKRKVHYALAWGNINLFDFNDRLQSDKISLHLWTMPQGQEEMLNPIGIPGSNPHQDSPGLEIEFDWFGQPVLFPSHEQMIEFGEMMANEDGTNKNSISPPHSPVSSTPTEAEWDLLREIIRRDPLSEISEQEKELIWRLRKSCQNIVGSLPKVLASVKWNSREDVAQMYMLLRDWPCIPVQSALELLYCTYTDSTVRDFAVESLRMMSDCELEQFLPQLVQVLKFEPYLNNQLTEFLLYRSLLNQSIGHHLFWYMKSEMHHSNIRLRFGLILESYCRGCGAYLKSLNRQVEALEKLTKLTDSLKTEKVDDQLRSLVSNISQPDFLDALQNLPSPLNNSHILGELLVKECKVMVSKKRPLWLVWQNPDPMAEVMHTDFKIMFKNGDDLRQDMLTLQVFRIMDSIWQSEGLDLRMIPYGCLPTGKDVGLIEVVRNAKTVMAIQKKQDVRAAMQVRSKELHRWIKEKNKADKYEGAIDAFTLSCAGYCVATFILGIGDRHPDNIMVNEEGQVFHIDFGHFLDHRKKKFGINRERVPFVLTEDFMRVIAKGADNPMKTKEFTAFMELCGKAYLCLRHHASIFITLFTMMLSCGIPELQSMDDIGYLRKTLAVEKEEKEALEYFNQQLNEAYGGGWTTKLDWFFHWVKHSN